jgi:hypothetical protein
VLPEDSRRYRVVGLLGTSLYFGLITAYVLTDWSQLLTLKPNEFGDFVAGILGPLAIFWLVLGFWQQGDELRSSVHALNLQSEELRNSVEQQKALVEVTRRQAEAELEALLDERRARKLATSPRITLRSRGGMTSGRTITSSFNIHNIGADCSDVRISVLGPHCERTYEYQVLKNGDTQRFDLEYDLDKRERLQVTVAYRRVDGSFGTTDFVAKPVAGDRVSFDVEEGSDGVDALPQGRPKTKRVGKAKRR